MNLFSRISILVGLLLLFCIVGVWHLQQSTHGSAKTEEGAILYYYCPMHPDVRSDGPGAAVCCGMQLVPRYAETWSDPGEKSEGRVSPDKIRISHEQQQIMGIRVLEVEKTAGPANLRVLGRVAAEESRVLKIAPPIDGFIRDVSSYSTGDIVSKNALLATFLNREILRPQQAYIQALKQAESYKDQESGISAESPQTTIQAGRENLEYLGLCASQIRDIARTRKTTSEAEIRAPVSGILVLRDAYPGTRFERGTELFRIVDASRIWVLADIYEHDVRLARMATGATVQYQEKVFPATIAKSPPQFDPVARTLRIRLELDNPGMELRPEMFVDVLFRIDLPRALTIPAEALIDTGREKIVYVDLGNGYFAPRAIETGWRLFGRVQVLSGLHEGERIVGSGNFLIDSERRVEGLSHHRS